MTCSFLLSLRVMGDITTETQNSNETKDENRRNLALLENLPPASVRSYVSEQVKKNQHFG
jgi:hypothetical protein